MCDTKVLYVAARDVDRFWDQVKDYIAAALEMSHGEYTVQDAYNLVSAGEWVLLLAVRGSDIVGAATAELIRRPRDTIAFITSAGGRFISSPGVADQLKELFKYMGATKIEGAVSESRSRLWRKLGFTEKYRIIEVVL